MKFHIYSTKNPGFYLPIWEKDPSNKPIVTENYLVTIEAKSGGDAIRKYLGHSSVIVKTPDTERAYNLCIYGMPYDTSYGSFNYLAWDALRACKKWMERFERERDEARSELNNLKSNNPQ